MNKKQKMKMKKITLYRLHQNMHESFITRNNRIEE